MKRECTAELRRVKPSAKWPDRFSRKETCRPKPESFLETGTLVKLDEIGDGAVGDGGDLPEDWLLFVPVELVDGLSAPREPSALDCRKALYTDVRLCTLVASPKVVELSLT